MADQAKTSSEKVLETKDGLVSVPASQKPLETNEFFANQKLPTALQRYNIYQTDAGPVLERKPLVPWAGEHDERMKDIVRLARQNIETEGRYLRKTTSHIRELALGTDKPLERAFQQFQDTFKAQYGQEAGEAVTEWRQARNLPTTANQMQSERQSHSFESSQ